MIGNHLLKGWSKTQTLVALSSGESELYATLKVASEGLGLISIARDLGIQLEGEVWGDASAALGIIKRGGLRRTQQIDTGLLWIQEVAAQKRLKFGKVLGRDNPADLFTKYLDWETVLRHCMRASTTCDDGRAETAPKLHLLKAVWEVDDEDNSEEINAILSGMYRSVTTYEPDEFGLLQPVMCMLAVRGTGSCRRRPIEPGNNNNNAPLRGIISARTPANDPEGNHNIEPEAKTSEDDGQTVRSVSNGFACEWRYRPHAATRDSQWPRPHHSQRSLCATYQQKDHHNNNNGSNNNNSALLVHNAHHHITTTTNTNNSENTIKDDDDTTTTVSATTTVTTSTTLHRLTQVW